MRDEETMQAHTGATSICVRLEAVWMEGGGGGGGAKRDPKPQER